jgi:hypothetical protein
MVVAGVIHVVKDKCEGSMQPPHVVVLTGATIWAICSTVLFMVSVVGCPTMTLRGLATMMRLTV